MKVKKLAGLTKIKLDKDEEKQFEKELNKILKYFKILDEIDPDKIKNDYFSPVQTYNIYREDREEKEKTFIPKNLLDNIACDSNNYVKVKAIFKNTKQ